MPYKRFLVYIGYFSLFIIFIGCTGLLFSSRIKNKEGEPQKKIGAVYMTMNNPYFEVINEEIKAVVTTKGDVLITRDSALNAEMQLRQIQELLDENIDLLLINAVDWKKITPGLKSAKKAGVPVLSLDTKVYEESLIAGTVRSDNYKAGKECAKNLITKKTSGKILFLIQSNNKSAIDRIQGFKDQLDEENWPYQVVDELECMGQLEIAQPLVENVIKKGKQIDVVMALNDPSALGAMAALDGADKLSDVLVYSVDGAPEAKTMVYEKKMTATIAQSPIKTGETAAGLVYDLLSGKKIKRDTIIPIQIVTEETIGQFPLSGWQ